MSLQQLAGQLQAKGRGNDRMLVHMSPAEVAALQRVAYAHGGSLSINPETGLVEAGFLEAILPTVAGLGLTALSGGALSPVMAGLIVGGGTAAITGNLKKGLLAGLGAYGGGSLASGLAEAGAGALGAAAETAGSTAANLGVAGASTAPGSQAAMLAQQNAGLGLEGLESVRSAASYAPGASVPGAVPTPSTWDKLSAGWGKVTEAPMDFLKQNKLGLAAAAAPMLMGGMSDSSQSTAPDQNKETTINPYTFTRTPNPNFGMPGQPYSFDKFTPGTPVSSKDYPAGFRAGGLAALAEGGTTGPYERKIRQVDPAVTAYNTELMNRATQEYVNSPQLGAFQSAIPNAGVFNQQAADAYQALQAKQAADRAANPPQPGIGGYVFDQATGKFSKPEVAPAEPANVGQQGMSDWDLVQRYGYNPYAQSGGAAAGGLLSSYAAGGTPESHLGGYSDGGRLLKGPGDGVSDDIPAMIGSKQPARLADGEFVVPARIVSEIGNGSTEAGARRLYQMMDKIQNARKKSVGKDKVAVDSKAYKHLPA